MYYFQPYDTTTQPPTYAHGHVGEKERGLEEGEDEAGERGERALVQEAPGGGQQAEAAGAHEAEDGVDGCLVGLNSGVRVGPLWTWVCERAPCVYTNTSKPVQVLNAAGWIANCSRVLLDRPLLLAPPTRGRVRCCCCSWLLRWPDAKPAATLAWAGMAAGAAARHGWRPGATGGGRRDNGDEDGGRSDGMWMGPWKAAVDGWRWMVVAAAPGVGV